MPVEFRVSGGIIPWLKKGGKVTINNCPGLNDLKSVCVFLKYTNIVDKKKIYYADVCFGKPHLVDKISEHSSMKIETKKQSLEFSGTLGDLFSLRAVCVRMQEMGENSCVYCRSPQKCPVSKLLKNLNRR